jgi:cytoskeleton protein RodZ
MPDQVDWRTVERDASAGHAVGRLLRDQRQARGLSIADIERRLRIRRHYIEALEQGRFDLLPGAAYIPAFLRAYSRHVGLDPEKVLTAYHLSGSIPIERPVALPADFPLAEKRAPIGLAVLTVLLVVAAGYGVWHYLPRQQSVVAEKVPPVPDRLLASVPNKTDVAPSSAPALTPVTTGAPAASSSSQPQEVRPPSNALPPGTWPAPRQESSAAATVAPPLVVAVPAAPPPAVMAGPSVGQAQAAQPPSDSVRPAAAGNEQEAVARPSLPDAGTGAIILTAPAKSDTQVIVRSNSWVELRSPNGDVLAQTYVRAGESYIVPAGIAYRIIDAAAH